MESYDIPTSEGLSEEEATIQLNRITADSHTDREHPWINKSHPQHKDFKTAVQSLYDVKFQDVDERTPLEQQMQAGLDLKVQTQNNRVTEAEHEMEQLVELGFSNDPIPDDIQDYQIQALKLQRLNAQENFGELGEILTQELRGLNAPGDTVEALEVFNQASEMDTQLKQQIVEKVIQYVYSANQAKG